MTNRRRGDTNHSPCDFPCRMRLRATQSGLASSALRALPLPNSRAVRTVSVAAFTALEFVDNLIVVVPRPIHSPHHDLTVPVSVARFSRSLAAVGLLSRLFCFSEHHFVPVLRRAVAARLYEEVQAVAVRVSARRGRAHERGREGLVGMAGLWFGLRNLYRVRVLEVAGEDYELRDAGQYRAVITLH